MEHWQFDGTVMSHWTVSKNTLGVTRRMLNIVKDVFGGSGFNRKSVKSIGINIYTGEKSSSQAVPNPV
jgi:hypothetical protein